MKLQGIRSAGDLEKERVVLLAESDGDIGKHMLVFSTIVNNNKFSSRISSPFWFPDGLIKQGDLVIVYTKSGFPSSVVNPDHSRSYFYYLGKESAQFSDAKVCAVLLDLASWKMIDRGI